MPTKTQIRRWKALELLAHIGDDYNYLISRLPLDKDHAEWLQTRQNGAAASTEYQTTEPAVSNNPIIEATENDPGSFKRNYEPQQSSTPGLAMCKLLSEQAVTKHQRINMHSPKFGKWYGMLATLDTGADENWISGAIVRRLGLEVTKGLTEQYQAVNGTEFSSCETVKPTWSGEGRGISHISKFRVQEKAPFDVLFGRNLLYSPEVGFFLRQEGLNPVLTIVTSYLKKAEQDLIEENEAAHKEMVKAGASGHQPLTSSGKQFKNSSQPSGRADQQAKESKGSGEKN